MGGGLIVPEEDELSLESLGGWDVATRYHDFKGRPGFRRRTHQLRRISAEAIIRRAQAVLGAVVHPQERRVDAASNLPAEAEQVDLDLEETLENEPWLGREAPGQPDGEVWMSYALPRRQPVILSVDTSLSMTGEKLALTAVALAVVLLQFPEDPIGIVAFENEARILKRPEERMSLLALIERFLDVPAQGYTHLEAGLRASLQVSRSAAHQARSRPASTVLLTDGKYTAGRDPAYLAPRFHHLVVLKMGYERASVDLCQEMAKKGHGRVQEVGDLQTLPTIMYGVVKDLLRGRSPG